LRRCADPKGGGSSGEPSLQLFLDHFLDSASRLWIRIDFPGGSSGR
jgi:hypothetical protein